MGYISSTNLKMTWQTICDLLGQVSIDRDHAQFPSSIKGIITEQHYHCFKNYKLKTYLLGFLRLQNDKTYIFNSHQLLLTQTHTVTRPGTSAVCWNSRNSTNISSSNRHVCGTWSSLQSHSTLDSLSFLHRNLILFG